MAETSVIVRVEGELKAAFTHAAKTADRTVSQLLRDFMRDYVKQKAEQAEYDAWLRDKVEAGRTAVREGRVSPHEEVERYFAQRRTQSLNKTDVSGA